MCFCCYFSDVDVPSLSRPDDVCKPTIWVCVVTHFGGLPSLSRDDVYKSTTWVLWMCC